MNAPSNFPTYRMEVTHEASLKFSGSGESGAVSLATYGDVQMPNIPISNVIIHTEIWFVHSDQMR